MKQITLVFFIALCGLTYAQERISDLRTNPALVNKGKKLSTRASMWNTLDSTFVYDFASIDLEYVWDDFSVNKFEQYDATYGEAGITSQWYFALMNETNTAPLPQDALYCDSIFARHDTVFMEDGLVVDTRTHYPFTPHNIWVNDLDNHPVEGVLKEGVFEECYILVDSVINGELAPVQDTLWYNVPHSPAYAQDSAHVFFKNVGALDTNILWVDNFAFHNYTYAYQPWSLGVATLDGVDQYGTPYEFGIETAYGVADYLTTRPIDLSGLSLSGSEVLYLTFIYQMEGFGNMPEPDDSLLVEFWNEAEQTWTTSTAWQGLPEFLEPDDWDTARIAVPPLLHQDGFRFRFKNYASLAGALDHWHIDYVSLEVDVVPEVGNFSDLAISYPLNTLLDTYTAVPWDHYKNTAGAEKMLLQSDLTVYNSDVTATIFAPGEYGVRKDGILQGGSPFAIPSTGIPEPNYLIGMNNCMFNVASDYSYDQALGGDQASFDVKVNIASAVSASNKYRVNDTTRFTQRFKNYYAYDDGTAEAAYGVEGAGALMAYQFEAYESGKLMGILMHFVPSVENLDGEIFLMTVWDDNDGEPGDIIYQDNFFQSHTPEYAGSREGFKYYRFYNNAYLDEDGAVEVGEVFYVGWQNVGSTSLNVGLDWNTQNGNRVFRNTAGSWLTSSFDMSLMIRPVFSTALDYTLSEEEKSRTADQVPVQMYPNPASEQITITGLSGNYQLRIFDMSGRLVTFLENEHIVNVSDLENGVYIVDVRDKKGEHLYSTKLIKNAWTKP